MSDYTYKINKKTNTTIEIEVAVTKEGFNKEKERQYQRLSKNVKLPGFRAGKAPKSVIEASLGANLFTETIKNILPKYTSEILKKEDLNPIEQVDYDDVDPKESGEVTFKVSIIVFPEIKLPKCKTSIFRIWN